MLEAVNLDSLDSSDKKYVFISDYAAFDQRSIETLCYLLAAKCKYPSRIFLLRGNQGTSPAVEQSGLLYECLIRFPTGGYTLWWTLRDIFDCLPYSAVIGGKIFATKGGLNRQLPLLKAIEDIKRPEPVSLKEHSIFVGLWVPLVAIY
jgi:serine/threonine-protein phosphatase PP1 catalytic subunit